MLRKVIVVGVGGSGGKTLRVMRASLLRQLRQKGWTKNELPECWQLLWVDSVSTQKADGFDAPPLAPLEYFGLGSATTTYKTMINQLASSVPFAKDPHDPTGSSTATPEHIVGWAPEDFLGNLGDGAGQMRAIGRVIALSGMRNLTVNLQSKVAMLAGAQANSDHAAVSAMFGADQHQSMAGKPICMVVSSVAGGSGSGMFLDVVQALKNAEPQFASAEGIFNILYTPDVFGSGGGMVQVPPNSLAAITEVLAGVMREPTEVTTNMYDKLSYNGGKLSDGFGPKCNFLVGAGNNFIPLGSQAEVYSAVGETLCALMTSYDVQDQMAAFVLTNTFLRSGNRSVVLDRSRFSEADSQQRWTQPFSSLGVSKLSVGGERFAEYSSHLIARSSIEKLLWPNFASKNILTPGQTWPMLISEQVQSLWGNFYQQTGFNHGENQGLPAPSGEVSVALTDPQITIQSTAFASNVVQEIERAAGGQAIPSSQWMQAFGNFGRQQEQFLSQRKDATSAMARLWVEASQRKLADLTSLYSTRYGYVVTQGLLEQFTKYLTSLTQTLEAESRKMENNFSLVPGEVSRRIVAQGDTKLLATDQPIQSAKSVLAKGLEFKVMADVYALAANLVSDYKENYLGRLIFAVDGARSQLSDMSAEIKKEKDSELDNPFQIAPRFDAPVPNQFLPAKTEMVLIDPNNYQQELVAALKVILPPDQQGHWQEVLVERGLLGLALKDSVLENLSKQKLLLLRKSWTPTSNRVADLSLISGPAEFNCEGTYDGFQGAIATWLSDINKTDAVAKLIRMSIYDFVKSGTPTQNAQRESDFKKAFANAAKFAAPYVEVDDNVRDSLYARPDTGLTPIVSAIPFMKGDSLFPALQQALDAAGMWLPPANGKSQSENWFQTSSTSVIDFFTTNKRSMLPSVFRNLMLDVDASWSKQSTDPDTAMDFWVGRRARPLEECVPTSKLYLQDMVTGWTLLSLFGLRKMEKVDLRGYKVSIWDHDTENFVAFSFPLLSKIDAKDPVKDKLLIDEALPMVLQTMAMAQVKLYMDLNKNPQDFSALKPYWILREIGEQLRIPDSSKRYLNQWMRTGELISPHAPKPNEKYVGSAATTLEERVTITNSTLKKGLDSFNTYCVLESKKPWHEIGLRWEIRDLIRSAYKILIDTAEDNEITPTGASLGASGGVQEDDGEFRI